MLLRFEQSAGPRPRGFELDSGQRLLLLGPTGCGKTTLLRKIAMLEGGTGSTTYWQGQPVAPQEAPRFRTRAVLVSQIGFRGPDGIRTHWSELLGLRSHRHIDPATATHALQEHLGALRLEHLWERDRTLREMSGGELQGVALARALALGPLALLLDEPTSAMDSALKRRAEDLLQERFKGAWVWVTHDEEQVRRLMERGARISDFLEPGTAR